MLSKQAQGLCNQADAASAAIPNDWAHLRCLILWGCWHHHGFCFLPTFAHPAMNAVLPQDSAASVCESSPAVPTTRPAQAELLLLAQWHPELFGSQLLPLKRGIFHDLMAAHAGQIEPAALKHALAVHTRSTRYLSAIANGAARMGLDGVAAEPVSLEHRFDALARLLPRKKPREGQPAPELWFQRRIAMLFTESGLTRSQWVQAIGGEERLNARPAPVPALVAAALDDAAAADARAEAIASTFEASGAANVAAFASMYGLHPRAVQQQLNRAQQLRQVRAS